jgi:hypothetical protein
MIPTCMPFAMTLPGIFTTIVIEELAGLRWSQRCR